MKDLRRNEFIDMLEMAEVLFQEHDKFIKFELPFLGNCTFYPKANKVQIDKNNKWEENGFDYVKNILQNKTKSENPIQQATSLVKIKEVKSDSELRNEFAGLAMQSLIIKYGSDTDFIIHKVNEAFEIADAMVKRSKL